MKKYFIIACLFLAGCSSAHNAMSSDSFADVQLGMTVEEMKKRYGTPYEVHHRGGNLDEYEYIEPFDMGHKIVLENHYFIMVENHRVVGKRMVQETRPAFDLIYHENPNEDW